MRTERPDPDQLLRQVQAESGEARARLKVFLGASAGVGKTYAMLSEAHEQLARGVDIVVGYVECHGRKETLALMKDLEVLPTQKLEHRGVTIHEFDLDGALRRQPQIVIVDELAHTNAPGSRHPKRWQDIDELLSAGISVYTALNIQHIESLTDVVAQITGITVRETVPDAVLDRADDVELIDIPPEELRQRLREGKVYVPERIEAALEGFFKRQNLLALREMALRRAADRVEAETITYREGTGAVWATRERVLVCVAPNRLGERVVRAAARLGAAIHGEIFALYVESDRQEKRTDEDRSRAEEALRMAERLGMETSRRVGTDIVKEILDFAQARNVTLIVVGKPIKPRWREILFGSVVDELVRRSGDINVHVLTAEEEPGKARPPRPTAPASPTAPTDYVLAVAGPTLATVVGSVSRMFLPHENVVAMYLLGIAYVGARTSRQASIVCCLLSVAAYDFFFVPPRFSFAIQDAQYLPTFVVMLLVGLLISNLTHRMRTQAEWASARERRTAALFDLSRELSRARGKVEIASVTARKIQSELGLDAAVFLPNAKSQLEVVAKSRSFFEKEIRESTVAQWVFDHGKPAGSGTDTLPGAVGTYFPIMADDRALGVLGAKSGYYNESIGESQHPVLKTFANSMAIALERAVLARESHEARLAAEAEKLRSSLLSSVSHDIRTPLTVIQGAASALVAGHGETPQLAQTILEQADRLNRNVRNLLDMTRLDSGEVNPKMEWNAPEELVANAIHHASPALGDREVTTAVPDNLPLIRADGLLTEQALVNLLENIARHTPAGTPVDIEVSVADGKAEFRVSDRGPGVPPEARSTLFEKFTQVRSDREGFGLGLAIANAAMSAQNGSVEFRDRPGGGSTFVLTLPATERPPAVPVG